MYIFKFMDFIFKDGKFCIPLIFSKRTYNDLAMLGEKKIRTIIDLFSEN